MIYIYIYICTIVYYLSEFSAQIGDMTEETLDSLPKKGRLKEKRDTEAAPGPRGSRVRNQRWRSNSSP